MEIIIISIVVLIPLLVVIFYIRGNLYKSKAEDLEYRLRARISGEFTDEDMEIRDTKAQELRETRATRNSGK